MTATDPTPASPPVRMRSSPVKLLGSVSLGLLIVALAVGLVVTSVKLHDAHGSSAKVRQADAVESARISSLAAAKLYSVDIASYDYRTLDSGFATVTAHSTPAFTKTFDKSSALLKPVLAKYKAVAKANVVAAGLTSCTTQQAVALILLNQTVSNTAQKKGPTNDESKVSMTLVRTDGRWMIQQVQLL